MPFSQGASRRDGASALPGRADESSLSEIDSSITSAKNKLKVVSAHSYELNFAFTSCTNHTLPVISCNIDYYWCEKRLLKDAVSGNNAFDTL